MALAMGRQLLEKSGVDLPEITIFADTDGQRLLDNFFARANVSEQQQADMRANATQITAFSGQERDLFINTASLGWTSASPIIGGPVEEGQYHTVFHELFHVGQDEVGAYQWPFPYWLNEGGAHYFAAVALTTFGLYDYGSIRTGHIPEAQKLAEPLMTLETDAFYRAGSPYADEYSLAFLAVEMAVRDLPENGLPALVSFWQEVGQGMPWQGAFEANFGQNPVEFYAAFEAYRANGFNQ